ncbi:adenylate cyclase class-3/4/guanylyl cyclase [Massilia sp. Root418]|jgi:adenylate cyclase|uniref:CHASE2 domain-containing protein n=1 Tax=Massilia sp. Root418 TaxID=1736532 RepID=UPI0006F58000|nr:adenylate/guanylate cyclase domain-containing protein [Massilia sp. Root418]KQW96544.1 adenylate cyclase class-3/4/guanylyl cyclase [Massilia sp. Root418]
MKLSVLQRLPEVPVAAIRVLIALVAVLLTAWPQWQAGGPGTQLVDEWLRDQLVRVQASDAPEERMAVIDIDESSLAKAGPWPWPRERLATLVEQLLGHYGARGVALDLVLPERADAGGDERLAVLAEHGPVVLPQAFDFNGNLPLRVGQLTGGAPGPRGGALAASGYVANHAGLGRAAHIGNIGFIPDQDGMIRRLPMQTWFEGRLFPTLSLALLGCCGGTTSSGSAAPAAGPTGGMAAGQGLRRLPYSRSWNAYAVIPAAAVLDLSAPAELIRDKLVLIGSSSLGLSDRVATPISANTSGLLVHAAALTAQLDARAGLAPSPWPGRAIALVYTGALALLTAWTLPRLSALANVALLCTAGALWLALAYVAAPHDAVFSTVGPLWSILFLLAAGVPFAWQQAQRQSRRLLGTLRQYVADAVVDELLRSDLADPLAPSLCEVTTLIADMQGYTSHVANLPLEQAAQLTRDFLDCLTGPVLAARGTLDKYTGDGLVAFWGAPLAVPDHADQALEAAEAIIAALRPFNAARAARGLAPVRVRIGIESGSAMAGDFGSSSRSIYTAVGDSVNVASRLETAARDYPYDVIVGPGTAALARRQPLRRIGETLLRGRDRPTTLYTLAALAPAEGMP